MQLIHLTFKGSYDWDILRIKSMEERENGY